MLLVPALLIAMMYKGIHLIVALMSAATFGIILSLFTGLLDVSSLLVINMETFAVGGILIDGIMSLIDISVFAMLLMGLINLLEKGGFFDVLINSLSKYTTTPKSAEITISIINILLNILTVANSVVIVMEGPIAKKILVEKHNITPDRSANILDAVSCGAMCLIPYGFAPMLAYMLAGGSGTPINFSIMEVCLYSFHGWFLLLVMFVSMFTGWGRTYNE
jgi:Na+/H+ antiporter NhaC